jgi:DNA-directed RNA polymerase beta subunit
MNNILKKLGFTNRQIGDGITPSQEVKLMDFLEEQEEKKQIRERAQRERERQFLFEEEQRKREQLAETNRQRLSLIEEQFEREQKQKEIESGIPRNEKIDDFNEILYDLNRGDVNIDVLRNFLDDNREDYTIFNNNVAIGRMADTLMNFADDVDDNEAFNVGEIAYDIIENHGGRMPENYFE